MIDVKMLEADDFRAAHTLFRAALHQPPADDARWERVSSSFPEERVFGGYSEGLWSAPRCRPGWP